MLDGDGGGVEMEEVSRTSNAAAAAATTGAVDNNKA